MKSLHRPRFRPVVTGLGLCLNLLAPAFTMHAAPEPKAAPSLSTTQSATFGGGCFWCLEALFETVEGVKSAVSGYAGGQTPNPTYRQVCGGDTGHAEVVQIEFDSAKISFDHLLEIFWEVHDPTTLNRQGADEGTQYRSIILCHNEDQKRAAEKSKKDAARRLSSTITTEIVALAKFHPAEDDHQDYFRKNPNVPYCSYVIRPKLQKFLKKKKP